MREAVYRALCETDPARKCVAVAALHAGPWQSQAFDEECIPGRPLRPPLVRPRDVPHRGLGSPEGRAALLHAVAHIEFNAINLALDAAWRFGGLPATYYADWISVAQDEARHFQLLATRLAQLDHHYGDFEAHNGLWEAAQKTAHDPLLRMALVPRVLEARGLDVTPGMIHRLRELGDTPTVDVLDIILREEVRHVAIGTHWYHHLCGQRGLEPVSTFRRLLAEHGVRLRAPLNEAARLQAGFDPEELIIPSH